MAQRNLAENVRSQEFLGLHTRLHFAIIREERVFCLLTLQEAIAVQQRLNFYTL
jgi:hypothetical protein